MPRLAPFVLTLLLSAPVLHAQTFLAYGTFSASHLTNANFNNIYAAGGPNTQIMGRWAEEFGVGLTLPLGKKGRVAFGLDLRGSPRGPNGIASGLVGFKVAFKPPVLRLKPYTQFSFGYFSAALPQTITYATGSSNGPTGAYTSNYYESETGFELLGGVDYPIAHSLDVRVLELGIGHTTEFDLFGGSGYGHVVFTLNSGLVFHF